LQYLYALNNGPLAWLAQPDPNDYPLPEILVTGPSPDGGKSIWPFLRRLIDAETFEPAFTLDSAQYRTVAKALSASEVTAAGQVTSLVQDYDGAGGDTLRFGDGIFGQVPLPGSRFEVIYRMGDGAVGNVAADAINRLEPTVAGVLRVTNPIPATGGSDPETLDRVRRRAPETFRAIQYRAVLPKDYQTAAQTLPWVQRAGTVFRWTGSWLTVFTTADPLNSERITVPQRIELIDLLNRYRMAGYESYVPEAQYVSLDVVIEVCARPEAFRGDAEAAVLARLNPAGGGADAGFFAPDNFTFGQALERSRLEAAVQNAPGLAGVTCVSYRVRGRASGLAAMPDFVPVAVNQIIRCDNDPSFPEHGSLKVIVRGGK
jgi:predicted phage baseplate assembly protein